MLLGVSIMGRLVASRLVGGVPRGRRLGVRRVYRFSEVSRGLFVVLKARGLMSGFRLGWILVDMGGIGRWGLACSSAVAESVGAHRSSGFRRRVSSARLFKKRGGGIRFRACDRRGLQRR